MENLSLYQPLRDDELLFFIHIPKSAGISFNYLMVSMFHDNEVMTAGLESILSSLRTHTKYDASNYKYIRAHIGYVEDFFTKPTRYITFLRDPIKRVISAYKHIMRNPDDRMYATINMFDSFTEFMHNNVSFNFRNLETRMLSGYFQLERNKYVSYKGKKPFTDPMFLEVAKENLEKLSFCGVVEQYGQSIDLLEHTMGWKLPTIKLKQNKAPEKQEINLTEKEINIIRYYNKLDIELYEYATKKFADKIQQLEDEKNYIAENKIAIDIRGEVPDQVTVNESVKNGHCPICDQQATFSGPYLQCSNCQSTPAARAIVTYLNKNKPDWRTQKSVYEYCPHLLEAKGITNYSHSSMDMKNPYKLELDDNSVDIFISINTIDCMIKPEEFIEEAVRVVKKNGTILLTTPFTDIPSGLNWSHRATEISREFQPLKRMHYRKSPCGENLVLLEFSPNSKPLFLLWASQPTKFATIKNEHIGLPNDELAIIVINKKLGPSINKRLKERVKYHWAMVKKNNLPKISKIKNYHETKVLQEKIINDLLYQISKLKLRLDKPSK